MLAMLAVPILPLKAFRFTLSLDQITLATHVITLFISD